MCPSVNEPPEIPGLIASLANEAVATQLLFDLQFVRESRRWQELQERYKEIAPLCDQAVLPLRSVVSGFEATARVSVEQSSNVEGSLRLSVLSAATDLLYAKRYQSQKVDSVLSVQVTATPSAASDFKSTPSPKP